MEHERGQGYSFQIGYVKGTGGDFRVRIEEVPGGSAGNRTLALNSISFDLCEQKRS